MADKKTERRNFPLYIAVFLFLILVFIYKDISSSVFLKKKDRVNVVFYSQNTVFLSFSRLNVNYFIGFPASTEVLVPGGYGSYKVGALGKLISLENKPDLLKKTFSSAASAFVDLYFYPSNSDIYYQSGNNLRFPTAGQIILSKSNANLIDRLIILNKLLDQNFSNYRVINLNKAGYDRDNFNRDYQGSFYKKTYRDLDENVQIFYTKSYSSAFLLSQIIDGEGIRVVDISQSDEKIRRCQIITKKIDTVSIDLSRFFGCQTVTGETQVSDIILKLGALEDDWAVK